MSPTCQVIRALLSSSSSSCSSSHLLASKLEQVADRRGHCWTSTAGARSQWALPDLNTQPNNIATNTQTQNTTTNTTNHKHTINTCTLHNKQTHQTKTQNANTDTIHNQQRQAQTHKHGTQTPTQYTTTMSAAPNTSKVLPARQLQIPKSLLCRPITSATSVSRESSRLAPVTKTGQGIHMASKQGQGPHFG